MIVEDCKIKRIDTATLSQRSERGAKDNRGGRLRRRRSGQDKDDHLRYSRLYYIDGYSYGLYCKKNGLGKKMSY